LFVNLRTA
jgi:hypothetical protein